MFIELIKNIVLTFLWAIQIAMLLRAILSWVIMDSKLSEFLAVITEPFILPVRTLFHKLNLFQNIPIDISFMVTYLIISLLVMLLP